MTDLSAWTPRAAPARAPMEGRYVRLEPLDAQRHGDGLYEASASADKDQLFRWLYEYAPDSREAYQPWLEKAQASEDPLFFVVIDKATGRIAGRQTLMRIDRANGVIEIGNILWNPPVARKPAATEALYLFARHAFDDLGYRRFEWKCNNNNEPSKRAALRFGFTAEGVFRQLLREHPEFGEALLTLQARRMRYLYWMMEDMATLPLRARLAKQLLHVLRRFGERAAVPGQRGAIGLALVQDELAQLLGGSRQRINVELKWMEREGIIGIHQRSIVVYQQDQLEALAQQE